MVVKLRQIEGLPALRWPVLLAGLAHGPIPFVLQRWNELI
jgi:hypothetical protein